MSKTATRVPYRVKAAPNFRIDTKQAWVSGIGFTTEREALAYAVGWDAAGGAGTDHAVIAQHLDAILVEAKKAGLV